jgi:V8-like Glu-specific endopeptidase
MRSKRWLTMAMLAACADVPSVPEPEDTPPVAPAVGAEEAAAEAAQAARPDAKAAPSDPGLAEAYRVSADAEPIESTPVVPLDAIDTADAPRLIVGKDTRQRVADTSVAPYASAVMLWTEFSDGKGKRWKGSCSGTLIAPDAVLTAAHCLWDPEHGGLAQYALVIPGAYLDSRGVQQALQGVGTTLSTQDDFSLPPEFAAQTVYNQDAFRYDYAVIHLTRRLGDAAGYRPIGVAPKPEGIFARMIAYHSDLCGRTDLACSTTRERPQFVSSDSVRSVRADGWFTHAIDSAKGSSGGGISSGSAASSPIFAINIAQSEREGLNYGLLITPAVYADLRAWAGL